KRTVLANGKCKSGKDETAYVSQILKEIVSKIPESIRLPRRMLGDIFLKRGTINSFNHLKLGQSPVRLMCFNESAGALQAKFVAENVTFSYDWVYGDDETWGTATVPPQKVYVDLDIQQMFDSELPTLLGLYVSDFTNTKFEVDVAGFKVEHNEDLFKHQVRITTKTALLRDAEVALTMHLTPKLDKYLRSKPLTFK
ncbi:hypothetical protein B4U80_11142, partial [Leptotrombidium deliense]